jgi:hypothetical protein
LFDLAPITTTWSPPGFTTQISRPSADIVIGLEYVGAENLAACAAAGAVSASANAAAAIPMIRRLTSDDEFVGRAMI